MINVAILSAHRTWDVIRDAVGRRRDVVKLARLSSARGAMQSVVHGIEMRDSQARRSPRRTGLGEAGDATSGKVGLVGLHGKGIGAR